MGDVLHHLVEESLCSSIAVIRIGALLFEECIAAWVLPALIDRTLVFFHLVAEEYLLDDEALRACGDKAIALSGKRI